MELWTAGRPWPGAARRARRSRCGSRAGSSTEVDAYLAGTKIVEDLEGFDLTVQAQL
ncbi:MAG: hypothetical protein HY217_07280 [Candidatus Rokubacteria bacterium]|nr:hypothetical protein [Candidatus Rokubacteria bacterium]